MKRILVAPLNWGLGHATRCIPIIKELVKCKFEPIIASDGQALQLLEKEFPKLEAIALPSYKIEYPKNGKLFKWKLLMDSPKTLKAINSEKRIIKQLVKQKNIDGIISDNRLGVYHKGVPSVFVTHQLNVLSGNTTWLSSKIHQHIIKKFDECWIPDIKKEPSLSGILGHVNTKSIKTKYLGVLSRFRKEDIEKKYDLLVLLSGPEPQRTMLERILLKELKKYNGQLLFVKGTIAPKQIISKTKNITTVNFMQSNELEKSINESESVLARSGYTTILDLAKLGKRAFFIPTPGQFEQDYLARRLDTQKIIPYCNQDEFKIEQLDRIPHYSGFKNFEHQSSNEDLFALF